MTSPTPLEYGQYYHIYNRGTNGENIFREKRNYHHFLNLYARHVVPVADTYAYCLLRNHFHVLVRIKTVEEQEQPLGVSGAAADQEQTLRVLETLRVSDATSDQGQTLRVSETLRVSDATADQGQTLRVLETLRALDEFTPKKPSQQFGNFFNAYAKAINKAYHRTGSLFEHPFGRVPVTSEDYLIHLVAYIHQNAQKHGFVEDYGDWPYSSYHAFLSQKPTRLERDEVLAWFQGQPGFEDFHRSPVSQAIIAPLVPEDSD
jgi:hypothetical protein